MNVGQLRRVTYRDRTFRTRQQSRPSDGEDPTDLTQRRVGSRALAPRGNDGAQSFPSSLSGPGSIGRSGSPRLRRSLSASSLAR